MIRQTRRYLAGALTSVALVGGAVAVFVLLVTVGAVRDWPLVGFGGDGGPSISRSTPVRGAGNLRHRPPAPDGDAVGGAKVASGNVGRNGGRPASLAPSSGANPTRSTPAPRPTAGEGGGDGDSADPPRRGRSPAPPANSGSGSGAGRRGGSGGAGSEESGGPGAASAPSRQVADAVDRTVSGIDDLSGGTLRRGGVTEATERTVDEVAGPELAAGEAVDETVERTRETVGGLLGGDR